MDHTHPEWINLRLQELELGNTGIHLSLNALKKVLIEKRVISQAELDSAYNTLLNESPLGQSFVKGDQELTERRMRLLRSQ